MIMCRELTDEEIEDIGFPFHTVYGFNALDFARALFEAARVQQTQEREPNG